MRNRYLRSLPAAAAVVSLATMLCGCETAKLLAPPSLRVDLPTKTCEQILREVELPPATGKDDAHIAFVKDEAALITANKRIHDGRACVADVRTQYGGPKK